MVKTGKPQVENGFTRIANELLEALIRSQISSREMKIMLFLIRHTYGFHRLWTKPIGAGYISKCTGLHRNNVHKAVRSLEEKKVIYIDRSRKLYRYKIQKLYNKWNSKQFELDI